MCIFLMKCVKVSLITFKCYSGMQFLVRLQENTLKPSNTLFIKVQKCIFTMNIFFFHVESASCAINHDSFYYIPLEYNYKCMT